MVCVLGIQFLVFFALFNASIAFYALVFIHAVAVDFFRFELWITLNCLMTDTVYIQWTPGSRCSKKEVICCFI